MGDVMIIEWEWIEWGRMGGCEIARVNATSNVPQVVYAVVGHRPPPFNLSCSLGYGTTMQQLINRSIDRSIDPFPSSSPPIFISFLCCTKKASFFSLIKIMKQDHLLHHHDRGMKQYGHHQWRHWHHRDHHYHRHLWCSWVHLIQLVLYVAPLRVLILHNGTHSFIFNWLWMVSQSLASFTSFVSLATCG